MGWLDDSATDGGSA